MNVAFEPFDIPLDEIVECYRLSLSAALDNLTSPHITEPQRQACRQMIASASWLLSPLWELQQYAEEFPRKGIPR